MSSKNYKYFWPGIPQIPSKREFEGVYARKCNLKCRHTVNIVLTVQRAKVHPRQSILPSKAFFYLYW